MSGLKVSRLINPNALRMAKIVYNFGLSVCTRVKSFGAFKICKVTGIYIGNFGHILVATGSLWQSLLVD